MSTALFPEGLTRTAWDDLQYRCREFDDMLSLPFTERFIVPDPAHGWVIRESALITIGALTGPESHTLPGWTRRAFRYAGHVPAHGEQIIAMLAWSAMGWYQLRTNDEKPSASAPNGYIVSEPLYFRDPDGKSAPVDATGLQGWTLYTGPVIAPKEWTEADAVKTRDDGQPVEAGGGTEGSSGGANATQPASLGTGETPTTSPAPQPPAVKVGDFVLMRAHHDVITQSRIDAISPSGKYIQPAWTANWFPIEDILEIIPPRATEGPF